MPSAGWAECLQIIKPLCVQILALRVSGRYYCGVIVREQLRPLTRPKAGLFSSLSCLSGAGPVATAGAFGASLSWPERVSRDYG